MPRITCEGKADAFSETNELKMPLVIIYKKEDGLTEFHGFVPGITNRNCVSKTKEACKAELTTLAKTLVAEYVKNKRPFPFFPTKTEIMKDFENVVDVSFIKLTKSK